MNDSSNPRCGVGLAEATDGYLRGKVMQVVPVWSITTRFSGSLKDDITAEEVDQETGFPNEALLNTGRGGDGGDAARSTRSREDAGDARNPGPTAASLACNRPKACQECRQVWHWCKARGSVGWTGLSCLARNVRKISWPDKEALLRWSEGLIREIEGIRP